MSDPKICLKCCVYSANFIDGQSICIGCSNGSNKAEAVDKLRLKKEEEREAKKYEKNFKHIHGLRKERSQKFVRKASEVFFCFIILFSFFGCMPLTTESMAFKDVQKNLEINASNMVKVGKDIDKISDKLGLGLTPLESQFKDALLKQQEDNQKQYTLMREEFKQQMIEMGKNILAQGGQAMGIPAPVTAGVIGLVSTYGGKIVSDIYARRRKEREDQEWQEHCDELEKEHEKEKEEMRQKGLIKQKTMAKIEPKYQIEYDKAKEDAIRELRSQGEIN